MVDLLRDEMTHDAQAEPPAHKQLLIHAADPCGKLSSSMLLGVDDDLLFGPPLLKSAPHELRRHGLVEKGLDAPCQGLFLFV